MTSKNFIHKLLADYYLPPFSSYPPCPPFFFLPSKFLSFSLSPLPFSPIHPSLFLFQLIPTLSFISLPPLIPTLDIPFHLFHLYAPLLQFPFQSPISSFSPSMPPIPPSLPFFFSSALLPFVLPFDPPPLPRPYPFFPVSCSVVAHCGLFMCKCVCVCHCINCLRSCTFV